MTTTTTTTTKTTNKGSKGKRAALTSAPVVTVETLATVTTDAPTSEPATVAPVPTSAPVFTTPAEYKPDNSASYAARRALLRSHRLAKTSADLSSILGDRGHFAFTERVNDAICAMGIQTDAIFAPDRNPKVIKRFIQFVHGVNAKDFTAIDFTSAKILYALKLAGQYQLTTDALQYIVSGAMKPGANPETRGVSARVIGRLFGAVGATTAPTQISRSVGDNGFMQLAGMTSAPTHTQNRAYSLNPNHALVKKFFECVESATSGQLDELTKTA